MKYVQLTIKTPERRQWRRSGVFIVKFEHISHVFLAFLFLRVTSVDVSLVFFPLASSSDLPTIFQIRKKITWNMEKEWLTVVETVSSLISTPVFVSSLFFSASSFLFLCLSKVCSIWTAFWIHFINSLSANFTKWSNTLKQFVGKLPTNFLSVWPFYGIGA